MGRLSLHCSAGEHDTCEGEKFYHITVCKCDCHEDDNYRNEALRAETALIQKQHAALLLAELTMARGAGLSYKDRREVHEAVLDALKAYEELGSPGDK